MLENLILNLSKLMYVSSLCTVLSKYIYLLVYSEEKKVSISTCKTADDKRTLISMFYTSFVVQLIKLNFSNIQNNVA